MQGGPLPSPRAWRPLGVRPASGKRAPKRPALPTSPRRPPLTRSPTAAPASAPASAFARGGVGGGLGNLYFRLRPRLAYLRLNPGARTSAAESSVAATFRKHRPQSALARRGRLESPSHPTQSPPRRGSPPNLHPDPFTWPPQVLCLILRYRFCKIDSYDDKNRICMKIYMLLIIKIIKTADVCITGFFQCYERLWIE